MSGIAGLLQCDGSLPDIVFLQRLAEFLSFRGPDGLKVWVDGPVGFVQALLRTTREPSSERQLTSLSGRFWIVADARIDSRQELEAKLRGKLSSSDCERLQDASDAEWILLAYAAWGEDCVQNLLGDFAFAIWDASRQVLFCARDHFGIKPFYYGAPPGSFFFCNTLDGLALHPEISGDFNETAIADFLLFGVNYDESTTLFRDILRLPPAHTLVVSRDGLRTRRYWSPPKDGKIRHRHAREYVEHFQDILQDAVADRLRVGRAGILLSGGLDSSSLAATAKNLPGVPHPVDLRAYTVTYDPLLPDRDGQNAREVCEFLSIPGRFFAADKLVPFEGWNDSRFHWPEPVDDPFFAGLFDQFQMVAADCRVVLEGEGIDNLMDFQMWPYLKDLKRHREWTQFIKDSVHFLWVRPAPWQGMRRRFRGFFGKGSEVQLFPEWIAPAFAKRVNIMDRWEQHSVLRSSQGTHPMRPRAYASLFLPHWAQSFEWVDPGVTRCHVEERHPFLDLRILDYVLALPPFPWAFQKRLLREAMIGRLPDKIRLRAKTPLAGDPFTKMLQRPELKWLDDVSRVDGIPWDRRMDAWVSRKAIGQLAGERSSERARVTVRPLCLNFWLQSR